VLRTLLPKKPIAAAGASEAREVRAILEAAVKPQVRLQLGSLLHDVGRSARITMPMST
jgi:hypothetical protein